MALNKQQFTTEARYEYIYIKSSLPFTTSGGSVTEAIPHNLGYIPFFRVYFQFSGDPNYYESFNGPANILGNWVINYVNADTIYLNVSLTNFLGGAQTGTIFYRIYAEPQT